MSSETTPPEEADAIDLALAGLDEALSMAVRVFASGELRYADDLRVLDALRRVEAHRNRLSLLDHETVAEVDVRDLGKSLARRNTQGLLQHVLKIPAWEASNRVNAVATVRARTTMQGDPLPPRRPLVAAAQQAGRVSASQVKIMTDCLSVLDKAGISPEQVGEVEKALLGEADVFGPRELRSSAEFVIDYFVPDGTEPRDDLIKDRRALVLSKTNDGSYKLTGALTPTLGAKLFACLSPLAEPRPEDPSGRDVRTSAQRLHDALEELFDRLLRAGTLPDSGGTPATVIVTIKHSELLRGSGYATSSDGIRMSTAEVLRWATEADIITVVLNNCGAPLDLGRTRRVASPNLTLALYARDKGCSFPGCGHPPQWCQRHHIDDWAHGGHTKLTNMTLVCGYHHREFEHRGWACRLNPDGLPEWVPPDWIDPEQKPLTNQRILRT